MTTYLIELRGLMTRDIIRRECEAKNEEEVKRICKEEMPRYRVHSIIKKPS